MTERYSFAVDRHLVDGSVVWNQENIENSTLSETMNEGYVTAVEDSPTRYLSVLDSTSDISLENLNITLTNPKLEVEDEEDTYEQLIEQSEENNDQVVVFSVEGSDELFGIQVVQDEEGNLQKYQFQFRRNEEGQLEAIPETITLLPMDDDEETQSSTTQLESEHEFAEPVQSETNTMQIFVQEDNSEEHIVPDSIESHQEQQMEEEGTVVYENETEEDQLEIKPGLLQLQNVKQELEETQVEYTNDLIEPQTFAENLENQIDEFPNLHENEQEVEHFEYQPELVSVQSEENSISSELSVEYEKKGAEDENTVHTESSEAVEESEFVTETATNDSDENDYQIVEGMHVTGDIDSGIVSEEQNSKSQNANIYKHALKVNKDTSKIVKKDNKLYLYVVQHPEKENVDSLSYEMSNLCKPKVNPRSILKSSHAMFQAKNENESNVEQDERYNKRFARCKEAMQAMLFHNFINKTTIPQAPVRKQRLPRKQKIKPVERVDEEIVVQEVMVSNNGFVEAGAEGVNKEMSVTDYVELSDSDDDYDPKRINRKKRKHRRKRIEITISDDESSDSHESVIELDDSDEEMTKTDNTNNNTTPPKRRRGRPPKNKSGDTPPGIESPSKKSKCDTDDSLSKPEIPCPKCEKTFPSQNSLKTHLQHHNLQSSIKKSLPEYKYKCEKCGTTFINNILLRKHMCSKLFNCTVCKKKFPDLSSLNGHKRTHAKEQMVKSTTTIHVSPKKLKPVQSQPTFKIPKATKCQTCGKLCSSLQNLNIHMKSHKEFICGTCSKSFISQLMLEKHVRENCVKSPQTNRRTRSLSNVSKKSGTSPKQKTTPSKKLIAVKVKCDKCKMEFNNHKALFKHKVVVHKLETPDKSGFEKEKVKGPRGVPAARKLQSAFAGLNCELDFNS